MPQNRRVKILATLVIVLNRRTEKEEENVGQRWFERRKDFGAFAILQLRMEDS